MSSESSHELLACDYRQPSGAPDSQLPERFECGLLGQILPEDVDTQVAAQVCRACGSTFRPSPVDWNPVIASLVFQAASERLAVATAGERSQWLELQHEAERQLPVVLPDESDLIAAQPQQAEPLTTEQLERLLPPGEQPRSSGVRRWAVGITTAPRRQQTLTRSLESLQSCGFEEPHLFLDGAVELTPAQRKLPQTVRQPAVGAFSNFCLALTELLHRHPDSDAVLMVQDDAVFPEGAAVREYLERWLWLGSNPQIVSLYCCRDDNAEQPGWQPLPRQWKYGAVALVFQPAVARKFLNDPMLPQHLRRTDGIAQKGIDMLLGQWAWQNQVDVYRPTPSLVQHVGHVSTLWSRARAVGCRTADRFIGSPPLPQSSADRTP